MSNLDLSKLVAEAPSVKEMVLRNLRSNTSLTELEHEAAVRFGAVYKIKVTEGSIMFTVSSGAGIKHHILLVTPDNIQELVQHGKRERPIHNVIPFVMTKEILKEYQMDPELSEDEPVPNMLFETFADADISWAYHSLEGSVVFTHSRMCDTHGTWYVNNELSHFDWQTEIPEG